jgi:hypothetical protein
MFFTLSGDSPALRTIVMPCAPFSCISWSASSISYRMRSRPAGHRLNENDVWPARPARTNFRGTLDHN